MRGYLLCISRPNNYGLNPYYTGSYSMRNGETLLTMHEQVLILIILEVTL